MENIVSKISRQNRTICLPIPKEVYSEQIMDASQFRTIIDAFVIQHPELFPHEIKEGYQMKDLKKSKKLSVVIRRIEIQGVSFSIRPSFVLPYMTGFSSDVEGALFFRKFDVPFWALSSFFGKYPMYWYRIEQSFGRNSLVGTTIKTTENLPQHLSADEKHSKIGREKAYIATTVGSQCILGTSVTTSVSEEALTDAYGVFQKEAQTLLPDYTPKTVNLDGWQPTHLTWKTIFPLVSIIQCFLHIFIKMRDRGKKKHKTLFEETATKLWNCYDAETKTSFVQRVRRLHEWSIQEQLPSVFSKPIDKLRKQIGRFKIAYDFPQSHRTSNMLDRLMQRMDRHLFANQYFHGTFESAELNIRGWALLYNFAPSNPYIVKKYQGLQSPAERVNGFRYHDSWLQNLLVSASLGGNYPPSLKTG